MSNASTIQLNFWVDFKNYYEDKKFDFSLINNCYNIGIIFL